MREWWWPSWGGLLFPGGKLEYVRIGLCCLVFSFKEKTIEPFKTNMSICRRNMRILKKHGE